MRPCWPIAIRAGRCCSGARRFARPRCSALRPPRQPGFPSVSYWRSPRCSRSSSTAHRPAQAALMPQLARSPAELAAANVAWSAIDYAGFLLGSIAAGVLAGLVGLDAGFAACAAALALSALAVATLPLDARPETPEQAPGGLAELAEGVRTVRAHPELRLVISIYSLTSIIEGVIDVLIVVAAIELLGL